MFRDPGEPGKVGKPGDLWPVLLGIGLVLAFFVAHQTWSTGFFTTNFGIVEMALFYGGILSGIVPAFLGTLHLNRKTELTYLLLVATFWTVAAAWLITVFPFDFSHLTAVVPGPLQFILNWVTNDVGRILLGLALIGAVAFIPFFVVQYLTMNRKVMVDSTV